MITGFILVSVLCVTGGTRAATIAGVPADKVLCSASTNEIMKTKEECERKATINQACVSVGAHNIITPVEKVNLEVGGL